MTMAEYRSHYAIWAVLASPLILGADITSLKQKHPDCLELLLNPESNFTKQSRNQRSHSLV